eukprot:9038049-Alexandrium_andersonii.AAC.1
MEAGPILKHIAGAARAQALGTVRFKHCAASEFVAMNEHVSVAACAKDKRPSSSSHPGFLRMAPRIGITGKDVGAAV